MLWVADSCCSRRAPEISSHTRRGLRAMVICMRPRCCVAMHFINRCTVAHDGWWSEISHRACDRFAYQMILLYVPFNIFVPCHGGGRGPTITEKLLGAIVVHKNTGGAIARMTRMQVQCAFSKLARIGHGWAVVTVSKWGV